MTLQGRSAVTFLVVGLVLLATKFVVGHHVDQGPALGSLSNFDLKTLTIRLERTRCYGTCPGYAVTIHGDGRVEYNGKSHVKETGTRSGTIEVERVRALAEQFAKARFWGIVGGYSEAKCKGTVCTDMPTVITELEVKGATHRVEHYYGCGSAPKPLFELETAIDKAANSEQWIGVSKGGPFGTTCIDRK